MAVLAFDTVTVSDPLKLDLTPVWEDGKRSVVGQTTYELLPQLFFTENFVDLANWIVSDSGGNVNVVGGVLQINGNGVWGANGVTRDMGARSWGVFEFELRGEATAKGEQSWIWGGGNALTFNGDRNGGRVAPASALRWYGALLGDSSNFARNYKAVADGDWAKFRIYIRPGQFADWSFGIITITELNAYPTESILLECDGAHAFSTWGANLSAGFQRQTNAVELMEIRNVRWYSGLPIDGPYIQGLADAGAGRVFAEIQFGGAAMPAGVSTANLLFAYTLDNGANWSNWLTLAQLQGVGTVYGVRQPGVRVQGNSDGVTQVYLAFPGIPFLPPISGTNVIRVVGQQLEIH